MSATDKVLIEAQDCPVAITVLYITPASTRTKIDRFTATNTTGAPITLTVYLIPPAGTAGTSNMIVSAKSIAAGADEPITSPAGHTLAAGGAVAVVASGAGLTIRATGREYA